MKGGYRGSIYWLQFIRLSRKSRPAAARGCTAASRGPALRSPGQEPTPRRPLRVLPAPASAFPPCWDRPWDPVNAGGVLLQRGFQQSGGVGHDYSSAVPTSVAQAQALSTQDKQSTETTAAFPSFSIPSPQPPPPFFLHYPPLEKKSAISKLHNIISCVSQAPVNH